MLIIALPQVNIPKTRKTYCKGKECRKHTQHKVTQYKAGKVRNQRLPQRALHISPSSQYRR
jgi:ribosomal protein L44E